MPYTSTLQNSLVLLAIVSTILLLVAFSPCEITHAENHPLNVELENEVTLAPAEQDMISDFDSEITLSCETEKLEFETSSEFDLEGFTEGKILLGIEIDPVETECQLNFDPQKSQLESCELAGDLQLDPKTSLELEYERDYPAKGETADSEMVLTFDRELTEYLSVEVEKEFSDTEQQLSPVPAETEVDLSGLGGKNFGLDSELEFKKTELEEIEFDFEVTDSSFAESGLVPEGSVSWKLSEKFVEFEPEFGLEIGNLTLETVLYLSNKTRITKLQLVKVSLDDLELAGWELELSNNFETGESEITLERNRESLDVEFEFEIGAEKSDGLFNLGQRTGELTWDPEEFLSLAVEIESGPSYPPEISLATEYEF
ncbi:hypothetical protein KGY79_03420 [Candidatus Bipolaricaulota bacterium]|nr:hypothetical protein [Candidatus Bipolaricaulota bacterium]